MDPTDTDPQRWKKECLRNAMTIESNCNTAVLIKKLKYTIFLKEREVIIIL
jgi:hypothetical protein